MKVVGIELQDYVSKKTNNRVIGCSLHCIAENGADKRVNGSRVASVFVSGKVGNEEAYNVACKLNLGCNVVFYYDQFGNVIGVKEVK